jgi:hypothetical protein
MINMFLALVLAVVTGQLPPGEPIKSLSVQGRYVAINGRPTFLVGQMSYEFARGRTTKDVCEILDAMMVPFGMNLIMGDPGVIYWGAWNNLVNVRKGLEESFRPSQYPWKRTGEGQTTWGGPRFDLNQFDPVYFDLLRDRLKIINERGIVPVVGIFSEHAIDHPLHWRGHPFHPQNNINNIGLPERDAIPEYFENEPALKYQEAYVHKLLETIKDAHFILYPFGEAKRAPKAYFNYWLRLFEEHERKTGRRMLVCISGASSVLDQLAKDPAVDLVDVYCYHKVYNGRQVNVPDGEKGIRQTITEAWAKYRKPVGKLYFNYGYPYADPTSPWADSKTGTLGGGTKTAAQDALRAVYDSGGFGIYFKMAWARGRGEYMKPDIWSEYIREFWEALGSKSQKQPDIR